VEGAVLRFNWNGLRAALPFFCASLPFLVADSAPGATRSWDGGGGDAFWMTAGNWAADIAPVAGDDLVFPAGALQFTATNNFPALTSFASILLSSAGYTLQGNSITLSNGISDTGAGQNIVDLTVRLSAPQSYASQNGTGAGPTFNGVFELNGNTLTFSGSGTHTVNGTITGSAGIVKDPSGSCLFLGNNTYTGATTVNGGNLVVQGAQAASSVTVNGGSLLGTGTTGALTANGGNVSPGAFSLPTGILSTGNAALAAASNLVIELSGTTLGTQYDQLNVTGTVSLSNASLQVSVGYVPLVGHTFIILNNDGADAVVGTFNGLPENATFVASGRTLRINYAAGTGNDVVLTVTSTVPVELQRFEVD
jgi:autotransporter-associated beta strand protein